MTRGLKRIISIITTLLLVVTVIPLSASAEKDPESNSYEISGVQYKFGEDSNYEISSKKSKPLDKPSFMGKLSVNGDMKKTWNKDDVPAYEVDENQKVKITYSCDNKLRKSGKMKWHLIEDGDDVVDGIELDDDIDYGAVILQTSLDHKKWYTNQTKVNFASSSSDKTFKKSFNTNEVQLCNGCYYRVIVAYKLEKQIDDTSFLFIDTSDIESKKIAEVFEFYAAYKSAENNTIPSEDNRFSLGELVYAGNDDGYSKEEELEVDDPHYGWKMGEFYVSGYTSKEGKNTFVKNLGDRVTLWFDLQQDIKKLNGNKDIWVENDTDGYDKTFQTKKTNFKHGALMIRFTDHEGVKHDPVIYTDFLAALSSPGASTKVQLFEEGDYEVALDYMLEEYGTVYNSEYDYRVSFNFKIRNGNCMVYPFDLSTGAELSNESSTENGFRLDLARSRYLKVNVKRAVWTKGANGYVEDVREDKPAKDGAEYTDEGIYTITVTNPTTDPNGNDSMIKKIYVGTDSIMKASVNPANSGYSLEDIESLVDSGAVITDTGSIVMPGSEEIISPVSSEATNTVTTDFATESITNTSSSVASSESDHDDSSSLISTIKNNYIILICCGTVFLIAIAIIVIKVKSGVDKNEK